MVVGFLAVAGVIGFNYISVHKYAKEALKGSDDIAVAGYYRNGVQINSVVWDLWDIRKGASTAYIMGRFFQFAEEMKDHGLSEVRLAYKGETKFILDGDDFKEIGESYSWQNPVYISRTFPEKLKTPDGLPAYSTWTGGMLGVVSAQMDDVNEMARVWYLDDLRRTN